MLLTPTSNSFALVEELHYLVGSVATLEVRLFTINCLMYSIIINSRVSHVDREGSVMATASLITSSVALTDLL